MPATIDDPAILAEIEEVLKKVGYASDRGLAGPAADALPDPEDK
jgi:hypothetical protein